MQSNEIFWNYDYTTRKKIDSNRHIFDDMPGKVLACYLNTKPFHNSHSFGSYPRFQYGTRPSAPQPFYMLDFHNSYNNPLNYPAAVLT